MNEKLKTLSSFSISDVIILGMAFKKMGLILLIVLCAKESFAACKDRAESIFCRLKSCIQATHWDNKNIADPIQIIEENKDFYYGLILIPMGHTAEAFSFYTVQEKHLYSYSFPKEQKIGSSCNKEDVFTSIDTPSQCKSVLPFGLGCIFKKSPSIKVQPFRETYWDGRKVNFLCWDWADSKNEEPMVNVSASKKEEALEKMSQIITPILKFRMKQLEKAIMANDKSMKPEQIMGAIKQGETLADMGDCRYFLDGNTLNLLIEAIEKKYPDLKKVKD